MVVEKIRLDFPILKRKVNGVPLVYLDNAATSQKPRSVIAAVRDYYENHNANVHRGIYSLSEEATALVEGARKKVADFIGAGSEREAIFVRNATEAINLVMYTWGEENIGKDDAVVISLMEHHSNMVPWQILTQKKGARLRVIDVDDEGKLVLTGGKKRTVEGVELGSLESLMDKKVKLVAVTAISNVLGTINPVEQIVKLIRTKANPKILVDACQSVPHLPMEVNKLKVDFLVFSGHKMLGPTGIGGLWAREGLLEAMPPFMFGGDMISQVKLNRSKWNQLPWKFEAGTPNMAGAVGLGAAVDYLKKVGMVKIAAHEQELTGYALRQLGELEQEGVIEIYGPRGKGERGGVVTFNVTGVHAHDTAQVLDSFGIAVRSGQHCAGPLVERFGVTAMTRASFYLYNTKKEIEFLAEKIREVKKIFKLS